MTATTLARAGLIAMALVALAGCAAPEESSADHAILAADTLSWEPGPTSLPPGARMALLSGDPNAAGPFTIRFELPADYVIPPHTHPATEHVTLLEGSAHVGMGPTLARDNATALAPGSFFVMPPGMEHFFFAGADGATIQLHGTGPWGIDYVDPDDDPRRG